MFFHRLPRNIEALDPRLDALRCEIDRLVYVLFELFARVAVKRAVAKSGLLCANLWDAGANKRQPRTKRDASPRRPPMDGDSAS